MGTWKKCAPFDAKSRERKLLEGDNKAIKIIGWPVCLPKFRGKLFLFSYNQLSQLGSILFISHFREVTLKKAEFNCFQGSIEERNFTEVSRREKKKYVIEISILSQKNSLA